MVTDSERIDFIEKLLGGDMLEVQKTKVNQPGMLSMQFEMFTVMSQRIYGNSFRELADSLMDGTYKQRGMMGELCWPKEKHNDLKQYHDNLKQCKNDFNKWFKTTLLPTTNKPHHRRIVRQRAIKLVACSRFVGEPF
jgi:hypothetical protein